MSAIRPQTVEVETSLRLVAPDAAALPVRASLRYSRARAVPRRDRRGETVGWVVRPRTARHRPGRAGRYWRTCGCGRGPRRAGTSSPWRCRLRTATRCSKCRAACWCASCAGPMWSFRAVGKPTIWTWTPRSSACSPDEVEPSKARQLRADGPDAEGCRARCQSGVELLGRAGPAEQPACAVSQPSAFSGATGPGGRPPARSRSTAARGRCRSPTAPPHAGRWSPGCSGSSSAPAIFRPCRGSRLRYARLA